MSIRTKNRGLALFVAFAVSFLALPLIGAAGGFAVESFTKYDNEASSYMAPSSANFAVVPVDIHEEKRVVDYVVSEQVHPVPLSYENVALIQRHRKVIEFFLVQLSQIFKNIFRHSVSQVLFH